MATEREVSLDGVRDALSQVADRDDSAPIYVVGDDDSSNNSNSK